MTFLLPIGLAALLLLPLIALLHLIQQRRERRRVPSLQIWRDLQRQTVQRQPRRLPLTLLLLLHLLLALLLGLALGQPLLQAVRGQAEHTAIVLDTSTSMAATDTSPSRLEAAKAEARTILSQLGRGDSAVLIELSAQPRILAQSDGRDTVTIGRALNQVAAGGTDGNLPGALGLAQATAPASAALRVVVLTDQSLRAATTGLTVAGSVDWITLGDPGDNVAIVAFAARPLRNGRQQLYARVANIGERPIARTLQLDLDGERAATEPMRLAAGAEAEWSWPLPSGTTRAQATLSGSDMQPLDDRAAVVLGGNVRTRVVLVTDETTPLERALRAQRGLELRTIASNNYQPDLEADLVVLHKFLPETLPSAPVLLVAPPSGSGVLTVEGTVPAQPVDRIADERFAAIDFKPVSFDSIIEITPPAWASAAVSSGSLPLVLTGQLNQQPVAIWAFDPASSNLPNRLAFPLLTAATTRVLLPQPNDRLPLGTSAPFALRDPNGETVAAGTRLTEPGIYEAQTGVGALAVNALDSDEAALQQRPQPTIATVARAVAADDTPVGRELWQPLVIAGLIVLAVEWVYSNRFSYRRKQRAQA